MSDATVTDYRRINFLDEMGLGPQWLSRDRQVSATPLEMVEPSVPELTTAVVSDKQLPAAVASAWSGQVEPSLPQQAKATPLVDKRSSDIAIAEMNWMQLKTAVANCSACGLCRTRTQTVFGVGDEQANWLFVGEGPGRNEDVLGEPFVGQAGKLLDNMLMAMDLRRGQNAYIANIVKCRPSANGQDRPPTPEEAATCWPFLERQIALVQPSIIVALGKSAALGLLKLDPETPVSSLRGKVHRYMLSPTHAIPVVVTYHPAYLLRKLSEKSKAWVDLCLAKSTYAKLS